MRPGNAETPTTLFQDLPDTFSAAGTQAPRARRLTATRSPHRTFKWAQHRPRGGRLLGSQNSKQTPLATWRKESWQLRYHHNKQTPQRDPAATAAKLPQTKPERPTRMMTAGLGPIHHSRITPEPNSRDQETQVPDSFYLK